MNSHPSLNRVVKGYCSRIIEILMLAKEYIEWLFRLSGTYFYLNSQNPPTSMEISVPAFH